MKTLQKRFMSFALVLAIALTCIPAVPVRAGGLGAAICVKYVTLNDEGRESIFYADSELTQSVKGPESGEARMIYGTYCYDFYIEPTAGTYKLTDINYPEGYELDKAVTYLYPLSVTVTEEEAKKIKAAKELGEEAGTIEFEIKVPLKKKGAQSEVVKKPKAKIVKHEDGAMTSLEFTTTNTARYIADWSYEVSYSKEKSTGYKTLYKKTTNYFFYPNYDEKAVKKLKKNTTYYFKIRYTKKVGKKTITSDWSKPVKIKTAK